MSLYRAVAKIVERMEKHAKDVERDHVVLSAVLGNYSMLLQTALDASEEIQPASQNTAVPFALPFDDIREARLQANEQRQRLEREALREDKGSSMALLRAAGWRIHSRTDGREAEWTCSGVVLRHSEALATIKQP